MEDLRTRAQLVALDRAGAVGTVVSRAEVAEAAAGGEFPATLVLDLDRVDAADGKPAAQASVAVDWDRETLEQLLGSTRDNEIALWFDERELSRAFDGGDVEAHGLRERAAVLAVAVAAAGASAAPSLASVDYGGGFGVGGGGGQASINVNPQAANQGPAAQPAGVERGLLQDEKIASVQSTDTGAAVSSSSGSSLSTGELAAAVAGGALLISAAGFGASRRRTPPVQPA